MLGYRVCWQLLLGWALLLGQPVSGDSDAAEEPPLAESEEVVPISQEPEEPVAEPQAEEPMPEPQEPEEPVSELQEPEEQVPVSEELEDPMPELEELELPVTKSKELTSDEQLEHDEERNIKYFRENIRSPWSDHIFDMQTIALEHHHKYSEDFYTPYEKATLITEKAHGTLIYLKMDLVKTNCTNDSQPKEDESDYSYYHRLYHADRYPRNCQPLSDKKQIKKCKFTFFEDTRNPGEPTVIRIRCYAKTLESEENFSHGALLQYK